jgi:hypothetical protein
MLTEENTVSLSELESMISGKLSWSAGTPPDSGLNFQKSNFPILL